MNKFQNSIPCSSLAATFRDAITITRNLGIQYLWIDSLCIIQDSRDDWEQESNKMGPVFRESTLALFAAASKSSNDGIFKRGLPISDPKDTQIKVFSDSEDDATVMASMRYLGPAEAFRHMWSASPLAARGWTFQEQALAPRCLVYGEKGICWKCPREIYASRTSTFDFYDQFDRPRIVDSILHSPTPSCDPGSLLDLSDLMSQYYKLVSVYSQRALTFPSDKLPAMSAIAKALSHKLAQQDASPTYLAGLWETDICNGLVWKATSSHAPHVSVYRAPSWSWASTDSPITFFEEAPSAFDSKWSSDPRVVSCEVCPLSPGYPFGEVKSGRLVVEGRTIPLIRSRPLVQSKLYPRLMGQCGYDEYLDGEDPHNLYTHSVMKGEERCLLTFSEKTESLCGSIPRCGELEIDDASYREEEYKAVIIKIEDKSSLRGILVQRRSGSEEYERVGYFSDLCIDHTWLDSIRRQRLVIV
ncbi:hypothetical protein CEP54_009979 [Fusarium duplospermum]|uniref:Heterokaryon incompatibility domain-containing protein n=1 Tax=Fusarium duplospermum TaxID=1325734 RepID=A0A428PMG9_9HYPO|nr:hypothetical protein CEP54_009979 [Fusarium duplospermum]